MILKYSTYLWVIPIDAAPGSNRNSDDLPFISIGIIKTPPKSKRPTILLADIEDNGYPIRNIVPSDKSE